MEIPAGELQSLRRESNLWLTDSCVIQRLSLTKDAGGGDVESWANLATVACRIAPSGYQTNEPIVGGQRAQQATYMLTLPALTDITAKDRVVWLGRTFSVVSVVPRSFEVQRRVYVAETLVA